MALRGLLAVVGVFFAFFVILAVQLLSRFAYPPPPGLDWNDAQAVADFLAAAPAWALLLVLLSYALGAFVGGGLAAWVAGRAPYVFAGMIVAMLLLATLANLLSLPHPVWFWVAALVVIPLAGLGGAWLTAGRREDGMRAATV